MVMVGRITIDKIGPLPNPKDWLAKLEPSQTLYSMVMNNHWWTNYKADQEGPTTFRYSIRPHGAYDAGAAQRFGIESSQPLVVAAAQGPAPTGEPLLSVEPAGVVVTSIQPTEDGQAVAVRLFNATGAATKATVTRAWRPDRRHGALGDRHRAATGGLEVERNSFRSIGDRSERN